MLVKLHANAATTPKMRAYIQASGRPVAVLVRELGISETTVRRWKKRQDVTDRASTPHTLATGFSTAGLTGHDMQALSEKVHQAVTDLYTGA